MNTYGQYPNTYYRVTLKGIIRDGSGNILMVKEASDQWDLPGGGWDHSEGLEDAFSRELAEEIDYHGGFDVFYESAIPIFASRLDACVLFLIYSITLKNEYHAHAGVDASEVAYINPKTFLDDGSRVAEIVNNVVNKTGVPVRFSV